jgi:AcrR family transcriptional regulator
MRAQARKVARRPPPVSRRERERAFRNGLILEAAEEVFAARGFQGASIEEIAARSEIAIATLYKLFGNKEAIFAAAVEHRQDELLREVEGFARAGETPAAQLRRLVEAIFRYFERHQNTFRIYLGATHGFPWHIRSSLGERAFMKYENFLAVFAEFLKDGMRAGAWPADGNPAQLAAATVGAINGLLTRRQTANSVTELSEEIRRANAVVERIVGMPAVASTPTTRGRRK